MAFKNIYFYLSGRVNKIAKKLGKVCLPIISKMYLVNYRQPRQGGPVHRNIAIMVEIL